MKETLEFFEAAESLVLWYQVSNTDGKIDVKDLIAGAPLLVKMYRAAQGAQLIPAELKSATPEDHKILAEKSVALLQASVSAFLGMKV